MNCIVCGRWTDVTETQGGMEIAICYRHAIRPQIRKLGVVLGHPPRYTDRRGRLA